MSRVNNFALRDDETELTLGTFMETRGFFVGDSSCLSRGCDVDEEELASVTFDAMNFYPITGLEKLLSRSSSRRMRLRNLVVVVLSIDGVSIGEYPVGSAAVELVGRVGTDIGDLSIEGLMTCLPHRDAEALWQEWAVGRPKTMNRWTALPVGRREAWLEVASMYSALDSRPVGSRSTVELDGTNIVDPASFFCAIGEAVNGPGGYFGSTLDALNDCLQTGYGVTNPVTLYWKNSGIALEGLSVIRACNESGQSYWDSILQIFAAANTDIVFT
jgi:RNAse (barnase) inhibitor barstar